MLGKVTKVQKITSKALRVMAKKLRGLLETPLDRIGLTRLIPTISWIASKQRLLLGYVCDIPRCYCCMRKFSSRSELRVNSADFEVGENEKFEMKYLCFENRSISKVGVIC